MEGLPSSFSKVEYLTIFATFVYGYVATQFFSGWGEMISHRKQITFSKEHLAWTILMFILLIDVWWGSWLKGEAIAGYRLLFYLSLVSPIIFYILSNIQFPSLEQTKNHDLQKYFDKIRRTNYVIFICLLASFYLNDYFLQQVPLTDYVINSLGIALAGAALLIKRRRIDQFIIFLGVMLTALHIFTQRKFTLEQYSIDNFSLTEYLIIFSTFIYGAVATKFFAGWGMLIYNSERLRSNIEYLLWTFFSFGLLIDLWWGQWYREPYITRNIGTFILSLTTPIACYFLSIVIFPVIKKDENINLGDFYASTKKTIIFLIGIILATNFIIANIMEEVTILSFVNILRIASVFLAVASVFIRFQLFHRIVLVLAWGMLIAHALLDAR